MNNNAHMEEQQAEVGAAPAPDTFVPAIGGELHAATFAATYI